MIETREFIDISPPDDPFHHFRMKVKDGVVNVWMDEDGQWRLKHDRISGENPDNPGLANRGGGTI